MAFEAAAGERLLQVPAVDPGEAKMAAIFKRVKSRGPGRTHSSIDLRETTIRVSTEANAGQVSV